MNSHFWLEEGGYGFTADDSPPLFVRARMLFDQPIPAANNIMIQNLSRLMILTADPAYADRINTLVNGFAAESQRVFYSMGAYFAGLENALSALHLVVIGPLNNPKTHELTAAILGRALPTKVLSVMAPEDAFPDSHPMFGKGMQNGQPTAYVCQRGVVSAPIVNPVALSQMLQLPPPRPQPGAKPQ